MLAAALLSVARMRAMCRHQAAGAALAAVLVTIRESSFNPTRAMSPTRTWDREPSNAAVGERWSLGQAFPGTDGLSSEVPRHWPHAIVTELRAAMRAIEIPDRRS